MFKSLVFLALLMCQPGDVVTSGIEASVEYTKAVSVVKSIKLTETTIDGVVVESARSEDESEPVEVDVAKIVIDSAAPMLRVKCRTAAIKKISKGVYAVAKPGEHLIEILGIGLVFDDSGKPYQFFDELEVTVKVGNGPNPPPDPDVDPPAPPKGLTVMVVYETATPLPRKQHDIIMSPAVRMYLNEHCNKTNGVPDRRFFDPDTEIVDKSGVWDEWLDRPRDSLPWVVISNGDEFFEGPLPDDVESMLELLKRYGGR